MNLSSLADRLRHGLLDLVFAPVCVACGDAIETSDPVRIVCRVCWARARPVPAPNCPRCWESLPGSGPSPGYCTVCDLLPPGVRIVRSAFVMAEPVNHMIHALKYRGWEAAGASLGARIADLPLPVDVDSEARLVVPVPISAARLHQRGYNQAELLARAFTGSTGRELAGHLLTRLRATETQTALHPDERRANVAGAFTVPDGRSPELEREHVLLIDDVWTTGATATACAEALLGAGARAVSVLTFARALGALRRGAAVEAAF